MIGSNVAGHVVIKPKQLIKRSRDDFEMGYLEGGLADAEALVGALNTAVEAKCKRTYEAWDPLAETRHELLDDTAVHTAAILMEHGIETTLAEQTSSAIADHLANQWRGATLNIPSDYHHRLTKRGLQILAEFNGRNHHALARKYDLTPSSIYKLLKRIQDRKFDRDQGKLDFDRPAT